MAKTLLKRSEVAQEHTWNIESVFPSDEAWEAELAKVSGQLGDLDKYRGRLSESAATLLEALKARDDLLAKVKQVFLYAGMQFAGDSSDQTYIGRADQANGLYVRAGGAAAFYEPEILAIGQERIAEFVAAEPDLEVYAHFFDQLEKQRPHIRSTEVETVLAEVAELGYLPSNLHTALTDADMKFATIKDGEGGDIDVEQGNAWTLIGSENRDVRRAAWEAYTDGYLSHKNTLAGTLAGSVKRDVFYARTRNYNSALEAALGANNIPTEVFHNLISTFQSRLPLWHRYWDIRRRALGVEKLHYYDTYVPLVRGEREVPYEEAIEMILTGMAPLGAEYLTPMERGLKEQRWVDIYPNKGKGSGAFSWGYHGSHPFLMLNYDDSLRLMSTLAHELGHSMHSYFTWESQEPLYEGYSMFVAETASNFNQALVRAHLLSTHDDPDFQLEVLAETMANFHRYLFIMPTLARFELAIHEHVEAGGALTAGFMSEKLHGLFSEAFGPEVELDPERVGIIWALFSHLFSNFYVYQYATGISAANALAVGVIEEGPAAAARYLDFLKAGDAVYPLEALKIAGIDMSTPGAIERAFDVLEGFIDRLDKLVGEGPLKV